MCRAYEHAGDCTRSSGERHRSGPDLPAKRGEPFTNASGSVRRRAACRAHAAQPRVPASRRGARCLDLDPNAPRGEQMASLPPRVRWKADNYNHLFEQPTIFYPIAIVLALIPEAASLELGLAWAYVALRVAHSIFQATVNKIEVRFVLFASGSLVLIAMVIRAAMLLI
jgi:hypothetical protein